MRKAQKVRVIDMDKVDSRQFQLKMMAIVAFFITPMVTFFTMVVQGMPLPNSISETGAIGSPTSIILPWALGGVGWFALVYGIKYNYNFWDRLLPICIFIGFSLVAWFPVAHKHLQYIPVYNLSQQATDIIHYVGAILGFGATILWVLFCFTKSNMSKKCQTKQKRIRNWIYILMGVATTICVTIIVLQLTGSLHVDFAIVLWLEAVMLNVGVAVPCAIKGGMLLRDKETKEI